MITNLNPIMRNIYLYIYILVSLYLKVEAQQQNAPNILKGRVIDAMTELPLQGSTIRLNQSNITTRSDSAGYFRLATQGKEIEYTVSHVGYQSIKRTASTQVSFELVRLMPNEDKIEEVVVSTGYQDLPITATTGSFTVIDSALYNRNTDENLLTRLNHVTPGLIFNKNRYASENSISIRGMNTIFGDSEPLIILDNYPYEGDIELINPNDVESVTVLKDAAAASIWGAKAGNGVIVIKTKSGKQGHSPTIDFSSSFRLEEKPNLFFDRRMSSSDYIDTEQILFEKGYFDSDEASYDHKPISKAVELMIARRDGHISEANFKKAIDRLRQNDLVKDVSKYLFRTAQTQQYNISLNGGSDYQRYYVSAGHVRSKEDRVGNDAERYTLTLNQDIKLFNNFLVLTNRVNYSQSEILQNNPDFVTRSYAPYERLIGDNGAYVSLVKDYRLEFLDQAKKEELLDWSYNPLDEIKNRNYERQGNLFRFNPSLELRIMEGLTLQANYQFSSASNEIRNLDRANSYRARDFVNQYTYFDDNGDIARPVPAGGILDVIDRKGRGHYWRGQIDYRGNWSGVHNFRAILGVEQRTDQTLSVSERIYGFEEEFGHGHQVDGNTFFSIYNNPYASRRIPTPYSMGEMHDNYRSFYSNASYTLNDLYTLSGSARVDQSNLFGVNTNQKGVPLYSLGASWQVSDEKFYNAHFIPKLRLRLSFGYNGNVNKGLSALPTARYFQAGESALNLPFATMENPPNPNLRWEKVQIWNIGTDFTIGNNLINGTVEYYRKKGEDLIGTVPYRPSSGINLFTGNFASTEGEGFDLTINSNNLQGRLRWNTQFLLSHSRDYVSEYLQAANATEIINYGEGLSRTPVEGKPLFAIYSYPMKGLTPDTGDPIGYLNDEESQDYSGIISNAEIKDLIYHGPARPTWFGAIRNTFSYDDLTLSFNVSFSFGYYFRKQSIGYGEDFGLGGHGDYYERWQKPGDEKITFIPSMPEGFVAGRDRFYNNSSFLVGRGDNIRIEDIRLDWRISTALNKIAVIKGLNVFLYANNLGVIWKKNRFGLDPDYQSIPMQRHLSFGLSAQM